MTNKTNIDKIDIEIIRSLQADARTNFSMIAQKCGVSTDTISKRFRRMKKSGTIRGTTVLLNPKAFGYNCIVSFGVDLRYFHGSGDFETLLDFLRDFKEIALCTRSSGKHDLIALALLKDITGVSDLKESIKRHPLVRHITTNIWTGETLLCPENFEFGQIT